MGTIPVESSDNGSGDEEISVKSLVNDMSHLL